MITALEHVGTAQRHRFTQRLRSAERIADPVRREATLARLAVEIEAARVQLELRRASVPAMTFPPQLPISQAREEIAAAIAQHQVVVVAGATGSGKTTQLPKICLELGRGVAGMIGHTQPRRLAARTVAERIAQETATELGTLVGYQVRFTDRVGAETAVKLMTDGILLAELQRDRMLWRYDTLIIDEAHERSLNIDFILGYLRTLLPQRPDLKVIVTSATIDPQRFADHFTLPGRPPVPVLEVSGRTYPVELRYRPLEEPIEPDADADDVTRVAPSDAVDGICAAVQELATAGPGDILVFLSGEREIRDTADALTAAVPPHTEIVPLYARLTAAEQHRAFQPLPQGFLRRVVLATNVAETSLTVPGIRYVIDPGTARISRYSHRTKVQRLPIEPISQASANQRAGRCGRVAEGICIRLYSEEDFESRPRFTDPEILRTNLASVILQMTSIGLGDIGAFPFLDPPDRRAISDGVSLLTELGALQPGSGGRLTDLGRRLAQLPVDPRMARMVLEADRVGCVGEVIIIAAAMSIQDVRERPADAQAKADESHRRFADPTSDFLAYLNLWTYLREQADELSGNQFRRMCKREYLNYLRVREWQDLAGQLRQITRGVGITVPPRGDQAVDPDQVHRALLAGLLSHVGLREGNRSEYTGARGAKFVLWPGSALARKPPTWAMVGELVETSRLFGRTAARIEPEWIEAIAEHLIKRQYSEPHWSGKRAAAMAYERLTLYGLPVVTQRPVAYGRIDPAVSRDLFIRHALVEGDWRTHHQFFHHNRAMLADVEDLEHRYRRRDLVLDDETLFDFYDARLPADVFSGRHFDTWWKKTRREQPELLTLTEETLLGGHAALDPSDFPTTWPVDGGALTISYAFEPGSERDGVSIEVPVALLAGLDAGPFTWLVPGLREELVIALIRALPKAIRTNFVPAPDTARAVLAQIDPGPLSPRSPSRSVLDDLEPALEGRAGIVIPRHAWELDKLAAHLRPSFAVVDGGKVVAQGKDLEAIRQRLHASVRKAVSAIAGAGVERATVGTDFAPLPAVVRTNAATGTVEAFPALVDEGGTAAVRVLPTAAAAQRAMRTGTRRLILDQLPGALSRVQGQADHVLTAPERLGLAASPYPSTKALLTDVLAAAVDDLVTRHGGPVRDGAAFTTLLEAVRHDLDDATLDTLRLTSRVLTAWRGVERAVAGTSSLPLVGLLRDVKEQVGALVYAGFVAEAGRHRLGDLVRYLRGVEHRLAKAPENVSMDRSRMERIQAMTAEIRQALVDLGPEGALNEDAQALRWMLEELRLSLFAQGIKTAYPISEQRLTKAIDALFT